MAQAVSYSRAGAKSAAKVSLDKNVFGVEVKSHSLLQGAYHTYLDNGRLNLAVTKKRGEVSGSTKKPWKQKGTGRARFGSRYNPLWRGGGITFGPTGNENYSKKINTKAKQTALRQALSLAATANSLSVIDEFEVKDGKTNSAKKLLSKINLTGKNLVVVNNPSVETIRATNNLYDLKLVSANYLNVYNILNSDHVVITKPALEVISSWLGADKGVKKLVVETSK